MEKNIFPPGTKAYCPPEVTMNGTYHAKQTTVWSLGILLFMMACGYYPTDYDLDLINKKSWTRPGLSQGKFFMKEGQSVF